MSSKIIRNSITVKVKHPIYNSISWYLFFPFNPLDVTFVETLQTQGGFAKLVTQIGYIIFGLCAFSCTMETKSDLNEQHTIITEKIWFNPHKDIIFRIEIQSIDLVYIRNSTYNCKV